MGGDGGNVNHAVFYAQTGGPPGSAFQLSFRVVGGIVKAEGHPDAVVPVGPVQGYAGVQSPLSSTAVSILSMVWITGGGFPDCVRLLRSAGCRRGGEAAFHLQPPRGNGGHQIIRDAVDDLFIKSRVVAVGGQVVFERFGFHALFRRNVGDRQVTGIRLTGNGAEGGKIHGCPA